MTRARQRKVDSPVEEEEEEDDENWEWADGIDDGDYPDKFGPPIKHTSFKLEGKVYNVGDTVQVRSDTGIPWVALIIGLETDYEYERKPKSDDDRFCHRANLLYFYRQNDLNRFRKKDGDEVSFLVPTCLTFRARYISVINIIAKLYFLLPGMQRFTPHKKNMKIISGSRNANLRVPIRKPFIFVFKQRL
jgi:hypothetical protein